MYKVIGYDDLCCPFEVRNLSFMQAVKLAKKLNNQGYVAFWTRMG